MEEKNIEIKDAITKIFWFLGISILALIGQAILSAAIPSAVIFNISAVVIIKTFVSISLVVLLLILFNQFKTLAQFFLEGRFTKHQQEASQAVLAFLLFIYTFPVYYLIAKRTFNMYEVAGAPVFFVNQLNGWTMTWMYDLFSWMGIIWGAATFIFFVVKISPLFKTYSEAMADKVVTPAANPKQETVTENAKNICKQCDSPLAGEEAKFCFKCGDKVKVEA